MKWNELVKLIEQRGWKLVKHGKKHDIYKHPNRQDIMVVERHQSKEIARGLLVKLMKQMGEGE